MRERRGSPLRGRDDPTRKERNVLADFVPLRRQRRLHRGTLRPLQEGPSQRRRQLAHLLRPARRHRARRRPPTPTAPRGSAATGRSAANGELVSALDGHWPEVSAIAVKAGKAVVKKAEDRRRARRRPPTCMQATRDSIRAIMMIRAYRMRGHLHADLDPLQLKTDEPAPELDPAELRLHRGRLRPQDLHR